MKIFLYLMNQDTPREQEVSLHFSQREPQQIDRLEVQNAQGGFTVTYQQNPDGYVVDDVPPELLDMERFIALMVSQAALTAKTRVAQPLKPLQDYGLDAPQARAELTFTDGGALRYDLILYGYGAVVFVLIPAVIGLGLGRLLRPDAHQESGPAT